MTPSEADHRPPAALVVIDGDDVYQDLHTGGMKPAGILVSAGSATRTAMGTGHLDRDPGADPISHDTRAWDEPPAREFVIRAARSGRPEVTR